MRLSRIVFAPMVLVVFLDIGCEQHVVRPTDADRARADDADISSEGGADADHTDDADAELIPDGAVDTDIDDAAAGSDADADVESSRRRGGYVVLSESTNEEGGSGSSVVVRFRFHRHVTWCGYSIELYGDCYLFSSNTPVCEPPCDEPQTCSWNDDCSSAACEDPVDREEYFDAGTVSVSGATHQGEVTCTPSDDGYSCDLDEEADFWEPNDRLIVSATGATYPPFYVEIVAPSPLIVATDLESWTLDTLTEGEPVLVEWDALAPSSAVEISLSTETTSLSCLSPDDGSFEIPAEGLEQLGEVSTVHLSITRSNAAIDHEGIDGEVKVYAEVVGAEWSVP